MGAVTFSIDAALVEHLRDVLPITVFVETGTFEGETIALMRPYFDEIHSIELSDSYFAKAVERFASDSAIHLHHGDSPGILARLGPTLARKSVLYWLDAHWCVADDSAGSRSQCPLLAELDALGELNAASVLAIDDARLFLSTPPYPHEASNWPRLGELIQKLSRLSPRHEIMVVNDVLVIFPGTALPAVSGYARSKGVDWLAEHHRLGSLEEQHTILASAASERLAAINDLTDAAEARMTTIEQLTKALAACEGRNRRPRSLRPD